MTPEIYPTMATETLTAHHTSDPADTRSVRVAVIGTGFAGLAMAIRLKQSGLDDFLVFERAEDVGGTWRDNTYPGAACDVPSHLYSFSFAPNPDWSRSFSGQSEIQQYLRDCTDRFGIRPHIRFHHEVSNIRWDDGSQRWHVETNVGRFTAQVVVSGMGALSEPSVPDIPGLDGFEGTIFHSARWNHEHDLTGERVAVVGTGASAIQVVPELAKLVGHLDLYQRTPAWVIPRWDRKVTRAEQWLYRRFPALQRLARAAIYWSRETHVVGFTGPRGVMKMFERVARRHLAKQVCEGALREILTPDYTIGCKRILISNDYYPALAQDHVEVIPSGVTEVRGNAVVDAAGNERPVDTIVFATGFQVTDFPAGRRIVGRGGRTLSEQWEERTAAYLGTAAVGFPNLFLLVGPNTGLGHNSMVLMIEAQVQYVLDALRVMQQQRISSVEVREEVVAAYNDKLQERMRATVWTTGGCASWYLDDTGRNTTLWPDFTWRFRNLTRRFDIAAYQVRRQDRGDAGQDAEIRLPDAPRIAVPEAS